MQYRSIEEANIADAAAHLDDATRLNDPIKIEIARQHLKRQVEIIRVLRPDLYAEYTKQLEQQKP